MFPKPLLARMVLKPPLMDLDFSFASDAVIATPEARVELRDRNKLQKPVDPDHRIVAVTKGLLHPMDAALDRVDILIQHENVRQLESGYIVVEHNGHSVRVNTRRYQLVRIFTGALIKGGRFYRPFWLMLPQAVRAGIRIDGQPTVKLDFAACHLRLGYFSADLDCPFQTPSADPNSLPG
jgi:hypothetical protein